MLREGSLFFKEQTRRLFRVGGSFFGDGGFVGLLAVSVLFVHFALREAVFDGLTNHAHNELD